MLSAVLFAALQLAAPALALWPQPNNIQSGSSVVRLAPGFDIRLSVPNAPKDLQDAVSRTKSFLKTDRLERLVIGRGSADAGAVSKAKLLQSLTVSLTGNSTHARSITEESVAPLGQRSEAYSLTVPADGSAASLQANSTLGLFRGLTTFSQMWYESNGATYAPGVPVQIQDNPVYPYRGFMLDTARNFFPVSDIKRTLDAMSWVKINTFHWHIVDSQSFPLQVPGFMEISQKGAYTAKSVYTPQDVKDIVAYAAARGIDVMPEFDTPGHTSVISKSHPEHVACPESTPWATYANEPPAGQLRITNAATTKFTAGLISAIAQMFPSKLFSIGGDEINARCYQDDKETNSTLTQSGQSFDETLSTFTAATQAPLTAQGKTPVVWEEMVLDHNVTSLRNDSLVLVWISSENAASVAQKGFRLVHAASNSFYLDCGHGGWVGTFPQGNSWCDPYKTWQNAYTFEPLANLTSEQSSLVMGGQHLLWTEQAGPSSLDSYVWPRAAASAELFWTKDELRNVTTALPRLHDVRYRMVQRGVGAVDLQPEWCAVRPGACDLTA